MFLYSLAIARPYLELPLPIPDEMPHLQQVLENSSQQKIAQYFVSTPDSLRDTNNNPVLQTPYDLNPISIHPLADPFAGGKKFIVPVPAMIPKALNDGIYHAFLNSDHTRFTEWFGGLFEQYVGLLLRSYLSAQYKLYTENDIARLSPKYQGKRPDFLLVSDERIIAAEVKACRIPRDKLYGSDITAIAQSFGQVSTGLNQIDEFRCAVAENRVPAEGLNSCKHFSGMVITFGTMSPLVGSTSLELMNSLMLHAPELTFPTQFDWIVRSVKAIEQFLNTYPDKDITELLREDYLHQSRDEADVPHESSTLLNQTFHDIKEQFFGTPDFF